MVIGKLVAVTGLPIVAVTPVPLNATLEAPFRFEPEMVAGTMAPWAPEAGRIAVIAGPPCGGITVKPLKAADVMPDAVVTVTVRRPVAAACVIVMVIGRLVEVPPGPIVAVTPVPLNVTLEAPVRLAPEMVAEKVPSDPAEGKIAVMNGIEVIVNGKLADGLLVGDGFTTTTATVSGAVSNVDGTSATSRPAF